MATAPEKFNPHKIWDEKIGPKELYEFIKFVWDAKQEKNKEEKNSEYFNNIQVFLNLNYSETNPDYASISVEMLHDGWLSSFNTIALFSSHKLAIDTFYEYASNKNEQVQSKDENHSIRRVIEVHF
jgi:hypothetical protein